MIMVTLYEACATVAASVGLFAGTNLDDMLVLAALNSSSRAGDRPRPWQIWAGQYAGITAIVVVSLLAAAGLTLVPDRWIWLLGAVPLGLGFWKLFVNMRARAAGAALSPEVAGGLLGVTAVTIANGADNIAAYTPFFRANTVEETGIALVIFAFGVGVLCAAGSRLVSHPAITRFIQRRGAWLVPIVFIVIGLYIVDKAGVSR